VAGYIAEACWRMNMPASNSDNLENFFDQIAPLAVHELEVQEDDSDESVDVEMEHMNASVE